MDIRTLSIAIATTLPASWAAAQTGGLIINEWNCVGSEKWIGNPSDASCEGPAGIDCSDDDDAFFGRIQGNGGNWIELVVTIDNLDVRGWQIRWAETGNLDGDGTNLWWGNGSVRHGIIEFTNDPVWANLRAGTILTIMEQDSSESGLDTDLTFDPCNGKWWINVNSYDAQYITAVHNRPERPDGYFSTDNDGWQGRIVDASLNLITGPIGEAVSGWEGGGINSREVGKLEADPTSFVVIGDYDDSNSSTFAKPNRWTETISIFPLIACPRYQDFSALRSWLECPCSAVILNEYNAVSNANWLNGGDEFADDDGGLASDSFFGRVPANAGNWFELVVIGDGVDMRGWEFFWEEVREDKFGTLTLSNDAFWSSVPAGTILTFIELNTAGGGLDSSTDFTLPGGNWANIHTADAQYVTTFHSEENIPGRMSVGHDDWRITLRDAGGSLVFGPVGEGAVSYGGRGIGSTETASLQQNPSGAVTPASLYSESILSTFGSLNTFVICGDPSVTLEQTFADLVPCETKEPGIPGDLTGDGIVDFTDLLQLLSVWGPCDQPCLPACEGDLNGDCVVDFNDLLTLLSNWG